MCCMGFSLEWLLLLQSRGSRHADFSSCGSQTAGHRLSSRGTWAQLLRGLWGSSRTRDEPVFPALAGGFFTTEPPRKHLCFLNASSASAVISLCNDVLFLTDNISNLKFIMFLLFKTLNIGHFNFLRNRHTVFPLWLHHFTFQLAPQTFVVYFSEGLCMFHDQACLLCCSNLDHYYF